MYTDYRYVLNLFHDIVQYGYKKNIVIHNNNNENTSQSSMVYHYITAKGYKYINYRLSDDELLRRYALYKKLQEQAHNCYECGLSELRHGVSIGGGVLSPLVLILDSISINSNDLSNTDSSDFLGKWLESIELSLDENVYYGHLVQCQTNDIVQVVHQERCRILLDTLIDILKPHCIWVLGSEVTQQLCSTHQNLHELRKYKQNYQGIPVFTTYTPQQVLATPSLKSEVWHDLKTIRRFICHEAE